MGQTSSLVQQRLHDLRRGSSSDTPKPDGAIDVLGKRPAVAIGAASERGGMLPVWNVWEAWGER